MDVNKVCGPNDGKKPMVPKFEAWVRAMVFEDVKVEDVAWKVGLR